MTSGIFTFGSRPKSKKAVREAISKNSDRVIIEDTGITGTGYSGPVSEMPENKPINFVGPDPFENRQFYGTITRTGTKVVVK